MKLLLHADVSKLGYFGDVVEVSEGYARNCLLPQRLAVIPTEENIKEIEEERAAKAEERRLAREALVGAAERVNGKEITIEVLANDQGHLFGSVSPSDIAKALREAGGEVQARDVILHDPIRQVGDFDVLLQFAEDIEATIQLHVVRPEEQSDDTETTEDDQAESSD